MEENKHTKMDTALNSLNADSATMIVRNYFKKVMGEKKLYDQNWIDWLDFKVIQVKPTPSYDYEVICEMKEQPLSNKKEKYRVLVGKDGIISSVEREEREEK